MFRLLEWLDRDLIGSRCIVVTCSSSADSQGWRVYFSLPVFPCSQVAEALQAQARAGCEVGDHVRRGQVLCESGDIGFAPEPQHDFNDTWSHMLRPVEFRVCKEVLKQCGSPSNSNHHYRICDHTKSRKLVSLQAPPRRVAQCSGSGRAFPASSLWPRTFLSRTQQPLQVIESALRKGERQTEKERASFQCPRKSRVLVAGVP